MDSWIDHAWEVLDLWIVAAKSLTNREGQNILFIFDTMVLSAHIESVSVSNMRNLFFYNKFTFNVYIQVGYMWF